MRDQDRKTSETKTKDGYTPRRERELIRQIKAGKKELLEDVIAHYYDEILRYVIWQIRDAESACDLTQEVFCRFIRRVDRYEYRNLRAYLYAAARNLCVDYWNDIPLSAGVPDFVVQSCLPVFILPEQADLFFQLHAAVYAGQLCECDRDVRVLCAASSGHGCRDRGGDGLRDPMLGTGGPGVKRELVGTGRTVYKQGGCSAAASGVSFSMRNRV